MSCATVEVQTSVIVESDCRQSIVAVVEQAVDVLDSQAPDLPAAGALALALSDRNASPKNSVNRP